RHLVEVERDPQTAAAGEIQLERPARVGATDHELCEVRGLLARDLTGLPSRPRAERPRADSRQLRELWPGQPVLHAPREHRTTLLTRQQPPSHRNLPPCRMSRRKVRERRVLQNAHPAAPWPHSVRYHCRTQLRP